MKLFTKQMLLLPLLCGSLNALSQTTTTPDWHYLRPDNSGLGGDYNAAVTGDHFGNIWLGTYMFSIDQGSVVRLNGSSGVFTNWGTYDGYLPQGQVEGIAFDNTDHLWVGTSAGMARYNGTVWSHWDATNSPLHMDGVRGLEVDRTNKVWGITYRYSTGWGSELVHYNGSTWSLDTAGQPTENLYSLAIDTAGVKWMGSDIGLLKYDGSAWTLYTDTNSALAGTAAIDVQVDSLNRVWCSSGGKLNIFDGSNWSQIGNWPSANFNADYFYARGNKLLVADYNSWDILIQNGSGWLTHRAPGWISDVYIDTFGHYWVTGQGFLSKFDGTQWRDYGRYNSGLAEYFNNDVFVDSKNRKWFANGNGGIQVFDCPKWESYGPLNGGMYPSPQTMTTIGTSTTEDSHGDIWFTYDGTFGYAVQIPGGNYSNYSAWVYWNDTAVGLPGFQGVMKSAATTDGHVFFLTYYGEIFMFDHATNGWSKYAYGSGLNVVPQSISAGLDGKMYVSSFDGTMDVFSNGSWTHMDLNALGAPVTTVHDIAFDSASNMWLATNEGVWMYDSTAASWQHWDEANSNIAADYVSSIEIDKKTGSVFVGAYNTNTWPYYGGISVLNNGSWSSYLQDSSPIPHKQVTDVALDTLGNLWIIAESEGIAVYKQGGVAGFGCIDHSLQLRNASNVSVPAVAAAKTLAFRVHPNPASGSGQVSFALPGRSAVRIGLYDLQGRFVRELYNGTLPEGTHHIDWNSEGIPSGTYLCRMTTPAGNGLQKVVVR